jgi:hypothetical protein
MILPMVVASCANLHFIRIVQSNVGINNAAADIDILARITPLAWASAALDVLEFFYIRFGGLHTG